MDKAHEKAQATRLANEAARLEIAQNRARAIESLQEILADATATTGERLDAARLILQMGKAY